MACYPLSCLLVGQSIWNGHIYINRSVVPRLSWHRLRGWVDLDEHSCKSTQVINWMAVQRLCCWGHPHSIYSRDLNLHSKPISCLSHLLSLSLPVSLCICLINWLRMTDGLFNYQHLICDILPLNSLIDIRLDDVGNRINCFWLFLRKGIKRNCEMKMRHNNIRRKIYIESSFVVSSEIEFRIPTKDLPNKYMYMSINPFISKFSPAFPPSLSVYKHKSVDASVVFAYLSKLTCNGPVSYFTGLFSTLRDASIIIIIHTNDSGSWKARTMLWFIAVSFRVPPSCHVGAHYLPLLDSDPCVSAVGSTWRHHHHHIRWIVAAVFVEVQAGWTPSIDCQSE